MDKYIPGQCNIGKYESVKRLKFGLFGAILCASLSYLFFIISVDKFIVFVSLFTSLFSAVFGILQYFNKFCVYYGLAQVFNFKNIKNLTKVENLDYIEKDKQKALKIILISSISAFAYAVLYIVIV